MHLNAKEPLTVGSDLVVEGLGKFTILKELGKGSFGRCLKVEREDGKFSVLKVALHHDYDELLQQEYEAYKKTRNIPGILQISNPPSDAFQLYNCSSVCEVFTAKVIELPLMDGDLYSCIENGDLTLDMISDLMDQLCAILVAVHKKEVLHRDISPDNILYERRDAKNTYYLSDFGISTLDPNRKYLTLCGKQAFVAPEMNFSNAKFDGKKIYTKYNEAADWWCLGLTICNCVSFLAEKTEFQKLKFNRKSEVFNFIEACLTPDPKKRLSLVESCLNKKNNNTYNNTKYFFLFVSLFVIILSILLYLFYFRRIDYPSKDSVLNVV